MKKAVVHGTRLLLGFIFFMAALNGYLVIFHLQPLLPISPQAMRFLENGYLLELVKTVELVCGLLLLINRFVPLALVCLAPIVVNIMAFHLFIDPSMLLLAIVVLALEIDLLYVYRAHFKGLLEAKSQIR
jgi:hypothetical protein